MVKHPKTLSPYDCFGVYKTRAEVNAAIRNGTFEIAKTMHVDKNGEFYFLTYGPVEKKKRKQVSMSGLSLSDTQSQQLSEARTLSALLDAQAKL